jgi:hypothetical protein
LRPAAEGDFVVRVGNAGADEDVVDVRRSFLFTGIEGGYNDSVEVVVVIGALEETRVGGRRGLRSGRGRRGSGSGEDERDDLAGGRVDGYGECGSGGGSGESDV